MRSEAELRQRIEQLEKRQTQDDAVLNVVNRYWNQLNEDVRVLLQRFDAETADESENRNENEVTTSFLAQLSTWDKEELDDKLASRVQVSKRAVAKVVQVIDRLMQRHEKMALALKGAPAIGGDDTDAANIPDVEETLRQSQVEIMAENRNLQNLNTSLHEKYHTISLKISELQDTLNGKETEAAELRNQIDDLQYELEKVRCRNDKLENHLAEAIEKLKTYHQLHGDATKATAAQKNSGSGGGGVGGGGSGTSGSGGTGTATSGGSGNTTNVNSQQLEDLTKDLEEQRELATNRLQELDKLHQMHRETLKEVEKLKMDIRQLPESVIVETTEYKVLQSQFSVLYNESMQIKTVLDETRNQLQSSKNQHLRQIEMMESEELVAQKKLRSEMIQMEDVMSQIRKEYEMLRIEFEQNMAANEQTAPINKEMRHLIASLQNHNSQLKGEVQRYKRKYKDAAAEVVKLTAKVTEATTTATTPVGAGSANTAQDSSATTFGGVAGATATAGSASGGAAGTTPTTADGTGNEAGGSVTGIGAAVGGVKLEPDAGDELSPKDELGLSTVKSESDSNSEINTETEEGLIADSKEGIKKEGAIKQEDAASGGACVKVEAKDAVRLKESDMVRDLRAQLK